MARPANVVTPGADRHRRPDPGSEAHGAAETSSVEAGRTIKAGRRRIVPFQSFRRRVERVVRPDAEDPRTPFGASAGNAFTDRSRSIGCCVWSAMSWS